MHADDNRKGTMGQETGYDNATKFRIKEQEIRSQPMGNLQRSFLESDNRGQDHLKPCEGSDITIRGRDQCRSPIARILSTGPEAEFE